MACNHAAPVLGCPDCAAAASTLVSHPNLGDARPDAAPLPTQLPRGTLVGRYVLLDKVGEGGMGRVYVAYDPELNRKVALKLLHGGEEGVQADNRTRLVREAQAMARLSHPNVVAVYDVGVYGQDVFLAMEYVEGTTLQAWRRETYRTWRESLQMLVAAGRGLAAAHAAGFVHRDFKPANVLIGRNGRVCVTDFGLVRELTGAPQPTKPLLSRRAPVRRLPDAPMDAELTQAGVVMGTPGFLAPEQIEGESVSPQTDQFAFCVTCYQSLYGELPFKVDTFDDYFFRSDAFEVQPPPPGVKVPGWVRRILLRGLSTEPEQRYPSMDALLEALGRDPAVARRRWLAVGAVAAAVLAAGLANRHATKEQTQLCQGSSQRLDGVWDAALRSSSEKAFAATRRPYAQVAWARASSTLDRYANAWTTMHRDACEATHLRGEQPESVLALRMECLEGRLKALGAVAHSFAAADAKVVEKAIDTASALPSLETCADTAALRQPVPPPADAAARAKLTAAQQALAEAQVLTDEAKLKRALDVVDLATSLGPDPGFRPTEAKALALKGLVLHRMGELRAAEETLMAAVLAADEARSDDTKAQALLTLAHLVGVTRGQREEGWRLARLAQGAITRAGGDELRRAALEKCEGDLESRSGSVDVAVGHYQEALALRRRHLPPEHPLILEPLRAIGWMLMQAGDLDRAAEPIGQAEQLTENLYGADHPDLLALLNIRAVLAVNSGDPEGAQRILERLLQSTERVYGTQNPLYGGVQLNLSNALLVAGHYDEALQRAEAARAILAAKLGTDAPDYAAVLDAKASALSALKRYREALPLHERAVALLEKKAPDSEDLSEVLSGLSRTLSALGRHKEAIAAARRALAPWEKPGVRSPQLAKRLAVLARAYTAAGKHAEAVATAERMLKLREDAKANPVSLAEARFEIAQALWAKPDKHERERALRMANEAREAYAAAKRPFLVSQVDRWFETRRR